MIFRRKPSNYVPIALFYEFAKTVLQDIESLETEIRRLKKARSK